MRTYSYDTFEDEIEIGKMVTKLQSESYKHMQKPDAWDLQSHAEAIKSTKIMAKKIVASL